MKSYTVILITVIFLSFNSYSQFFIKNYSVAPSSTNQEAGYSLEPSNNLYNTWTIAGYTNSPNQSWLFMKLNGGGVFTAGMTLGFLGNGLSFCRSHVKMAGNNNDILAGGYSTGILYSRKASWSMVDENSMTHVISKRIIDSAYSEYLGIARDNNNNFMPVGYIYKNITSLGDYYKILVAKYNSSQNLQWAYALKTNQATHDYAYSVCYQPYDDSWAVCGTLNYNGKIFILKLSQSGSIIWFKTFTPYISGYTFNNADARKIIAMPDGSFMIAGWLKQQGSANTDILLSRITNNGGIAWSYMYDGLVNSSEQSYSIDRNVNGSNLVITGAVADNILGMKPDVLNAQLDAVTGNIIWSNRRINNNWNGYSDIGYDVEITKITLAKIGIFFAGQLQQSMATGTNSMFMKTKPNGSINVGCMTDLPLVKKSVKLNVDSIPLTPQSLLDIQIYPIATPRTVTTYAQCTFHLEPDNENNNEPLKYGLGQNYPNPFNPKTQISFSIPSGGNVSIKIFDINGKLIEELLKDQYMSEGINMVEFDGSNLASGMYFYRLETADFTETKKMLLIK